MSSIVSGRRVVLVARVLLVGVLVFPLSGAVQASSTTTFSGQATVLQGRVAGVSLPCVQGPSTGCNGVVDTGPIAVGSAQANLQASLLCYAVPDQTGCLLSPPTLTGNTLNAEVLHAAVVARGDTSRAEASVANFSLSVAGVQINADLLRAQARATCSGNSAVVQAGAETTVTINGTTYTVGANQTQTIQLFNNAGDNLGYVVVNEGASGTKSGNSIDASALHVVIPAANTDLTVAAVHADVTCGSLLNCPGRNDFVTGGGFINPAGPKLHFALAGRDGAAWGHVLYKPTGLHVKDPFARVIRTFKDLGTELAAHPEFSAAKGALSRLDGNASNFQGAAILYWTNNGQSSGTIVGEVLAIDMGEPGRGNDFFEIAGLNATNSLASLGGGFLEGGNIQMHGKCPS